MTFPPRRNLPLLVLSYAVLGWVLALFVDLCLHPRDFLPPLALGSTAIGSFALPFGWLVREERCAIREKQERQRLRYLPVEVIPIERFEKPPGYEWWKALNAW